MKRIWLVEGVVIIASILIAFAVDAWWEERQERARETTWLAQIEEEMIETRSAARWALEFEERLDMLSGALQAALYGGEETKRASTARYFDEHLRSSNFQPEDSALQALVGSGDISLIESEALRFELARYARAARNSDIVFERYDTAGLDAVSSINRRVDREGIRIEAEGRERPGGPLDWDAIAADPVIRGDLQTVRISLRARRDVVEQLLAQLEQTLEMLEGELDRRGVER